MIGINKAGEYNEFPVKSVIRSNGDDILRRKPSRFIKYDYSSPGSYFITIPTHNKKHLLSHVVCKRENTLPKNILTPTGKLLEKTIQYINKNYVGIKVAEYAIMPNHIHLIIVTANSGGRGVPSIHKVIGQLKGYTTGKSGGVLWQRSYHNYVISSKAEYLKICEYMNTNVLSWKEDCYYTE